MNEHEFEPVRGLPAALPEGETLVWQGSPKWQSLAIRAFHVRKVAIYFLLLMAVCAASSLFGQDSFVSVLPSIKMQFLVGSLAIALLVSLAYVYSRTTIYTVTNRRIVLRFGVAVQMMINIPWEKIDSAGVLEFADGTGDILLETNGAEKMSYVVLWPHARPWHLMKTQPLLRSLPDAGTAAALIANLLSPQARTQTRAHTGSSISMRSSSVPPLSPST